MTSLLLASVMEQYRVSPTCYVLSEKDPDIGPDIMAGQEEDTLWFGLTRVTVTVSTFPILPRAHVILDYPGRGKLLEFESEFTGLHFVLICCVSVCHSGPRLRILRSL
ncbi:hypothetical protein J6590_014445 [Homalodisca vitripennis]|nr:hypothetical protein J6590_014445 [Homalodisca vitripennis]